MKRRLRLAVLISFILNGAMIITARYRLSYDAYTHMFFGDHYRTNWWSLWEPRWYTGFYVNSYPPLAHQLIGLLGKLVGVEAGFAILLWLVLTAFPFGVYAFSRVFTGPSTASYAALGAAVLPSLYLSAHTFGQLPYLGATFFALLAAASLANFLRSGRILDGVLSVSLVSVVMAIHHATLLFLPLLFGAMILYILLNHQVKIQKLFLRSAVFGALAIAAGLLVIWPFWAWGAGQVMQTPIDHASRHNYFKDVKASFDYFWPMYGPLVAVIPLTVWSSAKRRYFALSVSFVVLFILGLGGTTPLPRLLFGAEWAWLTYDRFALWASLMLLPFFGMAIILIRKQLHHKKLRVAGHLRRKLFFRPGTWAIGAIYSLMALVALVAALYPTFTPTQPKPLNMQPIVDFLNQGDRSQWRYVTFGFGDQFAYLSRLTTATTIDGSYHTARTLPELRQSGIGQIDTAFWSSKGLNALDPILQAAGGHSVRWGFSDLVFYTPILVRNGWKLVQTLSNGVQVWENPQAASPQPSQPPPENPLAEFSWGVLPLLAFSTTLSLGALRLWPATTQKWLFRAHALLIGVLPVSLGFWYFHTIVPIDHVRVYFAYDSALIYLSDAIALAALLAWGIARSFGPQSFGSQSFETGSFSKRYPELGLPKKSFRRYLTSIETWFLALCILATLSIVWSRDWRVSLYISVHIWLMCGLVFSLRDRPSTWRIAAYGSCIALAVQTLLGLWQYINQSTAVVSLFGAKWPGTIVPAIRGASVVQLLDGERFLRVYGSLPHPNILGGMLVALLVGPVLLFLTAKKDYYWTLILIAGGIAVLMLTFSRGAWIGLLVMVICLAVFFRHFDRRRLMILGLTGLVSLVIVIIPIREQVYTRISGSQVFTERLSIATRAWLIRNAILMIKQHPISGVGLGSFLIEFANRAPRNFVVEPVHNLPLLVISELGIGGLLILTGFGICLLIRYIKAQGLNSIILGAAMIGLCVCSLFDHYFWSLAPGRMLFGLMLGLWLGQMRTRDAI